MVAKRELFRWPLWAPAMRAAGIIEIDRRDRPSAIASLSRAKATIESGLSIWLAPEGTRSRDGALLPFKRGGFHLAAESGARILPVSIDGTRGALAVGAWGVTRGVRVRVTVSPPIDPREFEGRRDDLSMAVREAIARPLGLQGSRSVAERDPQRLHHPPERGAEPPPQR